MSESAESGVAPVRRLPLPEFVGMLALLFATVAFSIDAMLPALPEIAQALTPQDVNRAQLVLTSFVAGMGVGTLFAGPLSDATGRRPAIMMMTALYIVGAAMAMVSNSLEMLLLARFVQGVGSSGPRIVGVAIVRDLYAGREMAQITSFIMMIFILIPAVAPALGAVIIGFAGWHGIFAAFILFALIGTGWMMLRQPETLPPEARRPLRFDPLLAAAREVLSNRQVVLCTIVMTLGFGQMFALLSSAQQLFADLYGKTDSFPYWFAGVALLSGTGTVFNAKFVLTLGMRRIARGAYLMQIIASVIVLVLTLSNILPEPLRFPLFFLWVASVFFMAGVTFGNLNALALQQMGHVAGMATSIISAVSTIGAVVIAAPVGLMYNGTALPIMLSTLVCSALAWYLMRGLTD